MVRATPPPPSVHRHRHRPVTSHALRQQAGVPYDLQRTVCAGCGRVLDERRHRLTAA